MYPTIAEIMIVCCALASLVFYIEKRVSIFWLFASIHVAIIEILVYTLKQPELRGLLGAAPAFILVDMWVKRIKEKKKQNNE